MEVTQSNLKIQQLKRKDVAPIWEAWGPKFESWYQKKRSEMLKHLSYFWIINYNLPSQIYA